MTVEADGRSLRSGWLVGCDGARSTVRKAAGIGFAGTPPEFTGYSVQVRLADPGMLRPGRHFTPAGMYMLTAPGTIAMVDFDGGTSHRVEPLTRAHVESVLRRVSGTAVEVMALEIGTTWTDRGFQATAYRRGRVLLAGDAAHIHAPLGGQGLNLGIGDAMNLGWKLAATVRGDAPAGLLDSYGAERQPVAAKVLDWSRAQVALLRPDPGSRALAAVLRDLIATPDGATYFAEQVWGVGLRYDLGDAHSLLGRSAPAFKLRDGSRLSQHLRDGRGVLLDFEWRSDLQATAARYADRIGYVGEDVEARLGVGALLVRPDGIVAWVATERDLARGALIAALTRWFGAPAEREPSTK